MSQAESARGTDVYDSWDKPCFCCVSRTCMSRDERMFLGVKREGEKVGEEMDHQFPPNRQDF